MKKLTKIRNEGDYQDAMKEVEGLMENGKDESRLGKLGAMIAVWEDANWGDEDQEWEDEIMLWDRMEFVDA